MTLPSMPHIIAALREARGWRRFFCAFLFGAADALAFPPVDAFPVLWICFPVLIFLLQGAGDKRSAFLIGWSFAFGNFVAGLYWIAASMFVDIAQFWWAVPLAVAGLPALLALFYGAACVVARRIGLRGVSGAIVFALCWFLADEARAHLLTGFPWNLEGYAWDAFLPMLQMTSVIGIEGLTLLTLVAACVGASLATADNRRQAAVAIILSLFCLVSCAGWGAYRLSQRQTLADTATRIRIVQPNVDQSEKWSPDQADRNFERLVAMSAAPAAKPLDALIWPETASPFDLTEDTAHRYEITARLSSSVILFTGIIRHAYDIMGQEHYYNSLIALDGSAHVLTHYDKAHLVPFGEYIPFRHFISLPTIAGMGLDFGSGAGVQTLRVTGLPSFSPLICYEAVFSGEVADKKDRPQFLMNITNDGWYGNTSGPYQHFASARIRAIEEGLPLIRAANTGISGVIDANGRVRLHLGLGIRGVIDAVLPQTLPPTFFAVYGDCAVWVFFTLLAVGTFFRHPKDGI